MSRHTLSTDGLAGRWDEAVPLGNGLLGALVWKQDGKLRLSLSRADLWDERPMKGLDRKEFSYEWIVAQVNKGEYSIVQKYFDEPYETEAAPSKLPGAALVFDLDDQNRVVAVQLGLDKALCRVTWADGMTLTTFVHATEPVGFYRFEHVTDHWNVSLIPPRYERPEVLRAGGSVTGDDVSRLGYKQGTTQRNGNSIVYHQPGWLGVEYLVSTCWKKIGTDVIEGTWSISTQRHQNNIRTQRAEESSLSYSLNALRKGFTSYLKTHEAWWQDFWSKSAVSLPDSLLEHQWYLEQYKFGSTARQGAPPISLQAVWTADNGRLPPWKGDYHHDLNTELSYWPSYSGNHLDEERAFLEYLDRNKPVYRTYTRRFFGLDGLAVPGVTTLDGSAMGGWVQYSCSPTISAWLGHHFYMHWRYTMDTLFLRKRAYPWIKETALFLEQLTVKEARGYRRLPIGSSPEQFGNAINAWFRENTNYDLALMRFAFGAAAELASVLRRHKEAARWQADLDQCADYALGPYDALMLSPSQPYTESHRHFSHTMAIHPLGLIKWEGGGRSQKIIRSTLAQLDSVGPRLWCGYSYAWLANIKARAKDGEGAVRAARVFARAFCSPNSFHLNGDQSGLGYSGFAYRPFTLEGNFAFASAIQEMLLQSYAGFIEVFPAAPSAWTNVSFSTLRAEGAILVSAERKNSQVTRVKLQSEVGGTVRLKAPFTTYHVAEAHRATVRRDGAFFQCDFKPHGELLLENSEGR